MPRERSGARIIASDNGPPQGDCAATAIGSDHQPSYSRFFLRTEPEKTRDAIIERLQRVAHHADGGHREWLAAAAEVDHGFEELVL
jgi:hypothetical protein